MRLPLTAPTTRATMHHATTFRLPRATQETPINIGLLLVATALFAPLVLSMVSSFVMQLVLRARLKSLAKQTNGGLGTQATSLVCRAASQGSDLAMTSSQPSTSGATAPDASFAAGDSASTSTRASRLLALAKGRGGSPSGSAVTPAETTSTALVEAHFRDDDQSAAGAVPAG